MPPVDAPPLQLPLGTLVLDLRGRELRDAAGRPCALRRRALEVLLALGDHAGEVLSAERLLDLVWRDTFVTPDSLTQAVSDIRRCLGPQGQRLLVTVHRRGYRLDASPLPAGVDHEPLVGRATELSELRQLWPRARLLTVAGPGGVGKSRLAAELWSAPDARAGAWIDLSPLQGEAELVPAIADALALRLDEELEALAALAQALRRRPWRLALDNAEHLPDALARLVLALQAAQAPVALLITSRTALGLASEQVFRLQPLALPAADSTLDAATACPSVQLFGLRAAAADPGFAIDQDNWRDVVALCHRLDGLPLALELAAAHVGALGVAALLPLLDHRLVADGRQRPPRQRALHSMLDASVALLSEPARRLYRRLSVCAGRFDAGLVQALAAPDAGWAAADALEQLVRASLVQREPGDPPRHRLLTLTRDHAAAELAAAGEGPDARQAHACWALQAATAGCADSMTLSDRDWRRRHVHHLDDLRGALAWLLGEGDQAAAAVRLVSLSLPWWLRHDAALARQGRQLAQAAATAAEAAGSALPRSDDARLALAQGLLSPRAAADAALPGLQHALLAAAAAADGDEAAEPGLHALRLQAGIELARCEDRLGQLDDAEAHLEQAARTWRDDDPPRLRALWRLARASLHGKRGRRADALTELRLALARCERAGADHLASCTRNDIADLAWAGGELDAAAAAFVDTAERALADAQLDPAMAATPLLNAYAVRVEQGQLADAALLWPQALCLLRQGDEAWALADPAALALVQQQRLDDAARLAGYADARYRSAGEQRQLNEQRLRERVARALASGLSAQRVAELLAAGAGLTEDEALALAAP